MIAEQLDIKFDIERIQNYFNTQVKHLEPICQNEMFGGWSIQSTSGDYRDGFQLQNGYHVYDKLSEEYIFDYERAHREIGYTWPKLHVNLTQVGNGYIAEVIETLRKIGLSPHHARWTRIPPNSTTIWHRDTREGSYGVRLHIPVITNPDCWYETEEGKFHMPADGYCYLVDVSRLHMAYNHGKEDRIHIIMDVIDDVGVSKHHRTHELRRKIFHMNKWSIIRVVKKLFYPS
ncbi:aspartyl/asparaginyl beta-hydroxylase domain-containing protein [Legionella waltersii]|uniref:Aspartyl/Asparaginyl beta-hydroxylase n=1 Tax=Legionella waltersii TaxID=66969 RepID=A0A0W1A5G0_9GAMM|nr:aspartyl/asparaginyl beta-hydroxylase domain-containing protein [Legionella waltersii]KTD76571.1 Aspartyl/Asparaginyl beta-hydroxylase [Legionella waltersii]SNU94222.1 Aspartyl/Asparaginyl beta-hydroxylase [Legionella waltersii]